MTIGYAPPWFLVDGSVRFGGGGSRGTIPMPRRCKLFFSSWKKTLTEWKGNFSFHLSFWAPKARSPGVTKFLLAPKYFCTMHLKREKGVCAGGTFSVLPTTINFFSFHLPLCPKGEADSERGTLDGETEGKKPKTAKIVGGDTQGEEEAEKRALSSSSSSLPEPLGEGRCP